MGTSDGIWLLREPGCERVVGMPTGGASERFTGEPATVYLANCSPCHGLSREGAEGPALLPDRLAKDDDFYISTILAGRPKLGMPSWAVAGMSEAQARAMLEYLRSAPE
jgi:mono/diheme cytochrome c family protein